MICLVIYGCDLVFTHICLDQSPAKNRPSWTNEALMFWIPLGCVFGVGHLYSALSQSAPRVLTSMHQKYPLSRMMARWSSAKYSIDSSAFHLGSRSRTALENFKGSRPSYGTFHICPVRSRWALLSSYESSRIGRPSRPTGSRASA